MGGGGVRKVPKKCHVLIEWPLKALLIRTSRISLSMAGCIIADYEKTYLRLKRESLHRSQTTTDMHVPVRVNRVRK